MLTHTLCPPSKRGREKKELQAYTWLVQHIRAYFRSKPLLSRVLSTESMASQHKKLCILFSYGSIFYGLLSPSVFCDPMHSHRAEPFSAIPAISPRENRHVSQKFYAACAKILGYTQTILRRGRQRYAAQIFSTPCDAG